MSSTPSANPVSERVGHMLSRAAWATGLACAAAALLAGPAYRAELLSLGAGIQAVRWAASLALAGAAVALAAALVMVLGRSTQRLPVALAALVLNAVVATPPLLLLQRAQALPRIHDISTDRADPPAFVAVVPLRAAAPNPLQYGAETAAEQARGYPDIGPLKLDLAPAAAFERAERVARSMGWAIVAVVPAEGRIEATDTTLLFGFKDDVVIRIRPQAAGSVVDMRSVSRVGISDIGVNAERVRSYLAKLAAG